MLTALFEPILNSAYLGPDRQESIILKIIGKKIYNPPSHLQSILPENYRFFAYYSGKL